MADRVAFNADELDSLWGLPWLPQLIYMRVIRPNMDYATGVVGIRTSRTKRISYQAIREQVEVHETQGRTGSEHPSMSALRNAVTTLIRAGLIARVASHGDRSACLVFRCLLADMDRSVQNKYDRGATGSTTEVRQEVGQESNAPKAINTNHSGSIEMESTTDQTREVQQGNTKKYDTPPDTDLKTNTHITRARKNERVLIPPAFAITDQVRVRLYRAMVSLPFAESLLLEFVSANESSGYTSANWDAEFVTFCLKQKRYGEAFKERNKQRGALRLVSSGADFDEMDYSSGTDGFDTGDGDD